mmetsp:Transcript_133269/g.297368  ORF Transcript_133269/g.297368 Transcript_133269/m.297368 type:complete len:211 (-) Transcript_133269:250-882(-)
MHTQCGSLTARTQMMTCRGTLDISPVPTMIAIFPTITKTYRDQSRTASPSVILGRTTLVVHMQPSCRRGLSTRPMVQSIIGTVVGHSRRSASASLCKRLASTSAIPMPVSTASGSQAFTMPVAINMLLAMTKPLPLQPNASTTRGRCTRCPSKPPIGMQCTTLAGRTCSAAMATTFLVLQHTRLSTSRRSSRWCRCRQYLMMVSVLALLR